jgi:hypothetical protein
LNPSEAPSQPINPKDSTSEKVQLPSLLCSRCVSAGGELGKKQGRAAAYHVWLFISLTDHQIDVFITQEWLLMCPVEKSLEPNLAQMEIQHGSDRPNPLLFVLVPARAFNDCFIGKR